MQLRRIGMIVLSLVLIATPAIAVAASANPPGTYQIGPTLTGKSSTDGPLATTPAGAIFPDMTIRTSADPTSVIKVKTNDLFSLQVSLRMAFPSVPVTDDSAAFWYLDYKTGKGYFAKLDLGTGALTLQPDTGFAPDPQVIGGTDRAWLVDQNPGYASGPFTWRYYEGSPDQDFNPSDLIAVKAIGSAGLVYVGSNDVPDPDHAGQTLKDYVLRYVSSDGKTTSDVVDLGTTFNSGELPVNVAMGRGVIAWERIDTGQVGYLPIGGTATTTTITPPGMIGFLSVIPGEVALVTTKGWLWVPGQDPLETDTPPAAGYGPWSTTNGDPAFAATVPVDGDYDKVWDIVLPGQSSGTQLVDPIPTFAQVEGYTATNGHIAIQRYFGFASGGDTAVSTLGKDSATPLFSDVASYGTTLPPQPYYGQPAVQLSGPRSVFLHVGPKATAQTLVFRSGATQTGTLNLGKNLTAFATSGPLTAIARPASAGLVVGPTGTTVTTLPTGLREVAQDGSYTAYIDDNGSVYLRDDYAPLSKANPLLVRKTCDALDKAYCLYNLKMSGGFIVGSRLMSNGHSIAWIYDIVHHTSRTLSTGYVDISGSSLLSVRYSSNPDTRTEVLVSDLTAKNLQPRHFIGYWGNQGVPVFAGHQVVWPNVPNDLLVTMPTSVDVAALPKALDSVGHPRLLGVWAPHGQSVSLSRWHWVPQLAVSDSLTMWGLSIRDSRGHVVRAWRGGATTDGTISTIDWDGRDAKGHKVPSGTYNWRLTGSGPYGGPVSTWRTGQPAGTVTVRP